MTDNNAVGAPFQDTPTEELRERLDELRMEQGEAHVRLQQLEEEWRSHQALCTTLRGHIHAAKEELERRR